MAGFELIGEGAARVLLAIGGMSEFKGYATYEDIARITNLSLSRARTWVDRLKKEYGGIPPLVRIEHHGKFARVSLTSEGLKYYREIRSKLDPQGSFTLSQLIEELNNFLYKNTRRIKKLGNVSIMVDTAVPVLRIPELVEKIKREYGPVLLYGVALELVGDTERAIHEGIATNINFNDLVTRILNVPVRVSRVTDVSLPPNVFGCPMDLDQLKTKLSFTAVWHKYMKTRDITSYLKEAEGYGYVGVLGRKGEKILVEPRVSPGLRVIERVADAGFSTLVGLPSRGWIPHLLFYQAMSSSLLTVDDVLSGTGHKSLELMRDHFKTGRYVRWAKHVLGRERKMRIPTFRDLGVINIIKIDDEEYILTASAARRLLPPELKKEVTPLKVALERTEKTLEKILSTSGPQGEILKIILGKRYVKREELEKLVCEKMKADGSKAKKEIQNFVSLGILHPTQFGYYSSMSMTPIIDEQDELYRSIYVWVDRELEIPGEESSLKFVLEKLVNKGRCNIYDEAGSKKEVGKIVKSLTMLRMMGVLAELDVDSGEVTVDKEIGRRLLTVVLIEKLIGYRLEALHPDRGNLTESIIRHFLNP